MAENLQTPKSHEKSPDAHQQSVTGSALAMVRAILEDALSATTPDYLTHPEMQAIIKSQKFAFAIVRAAQKAEIPQTLINHYLYDFFVKQIALRNYKMVADLLRNLKLAPPEEQAYFDDLAFKEATRKAEQKRLDALAEEQKPRNNRIKLHPKATLADLNDALSADTVVRDMYEVFMAALYESSQRDLGEELLEILEGPIAKSILITDFFGCDKEDLDELPIDWIEEDEETV